MVPVGPWRYLLWMNKAKSGAWVILPPVQCLHLSGHVLFPLEKGEWVDGGARDLPKWLFLGGGL